MFSLAAPGSGVSGSGLFSGPDPGEHRLTLVDGAGRRLERNFRVLDRTAGSNSP